MTSAPLPVLGFDTETTGVDIGNDRIVTAAIVVRGADGASRERTWLLAPDIDIPERATAIHGVTTEYARAHGQDRAEGLDQIARAIVDDGGLPLTAFNAPFDLWILEAELLRTGLPTLSERLGRPVGPVLDPLVIDRGIWRYRRGKRTLDAVVAAYGARVGGDFHNALGDVHTTIAALDAILASPQARDAGIAGLSPAELHDWQIEAHRVWATRFNDWLRSQGREPTVDLDWP
jgi:DNA polymerase-3 subunit epsilon